MLRHRITNATALATLVLVGGCSSSEDAQTEPTSKTAAAPAAEPTPESQPAPTAPPTPPPVPPGAKITFLEPTPGKFAGPLVDGKVVVPVKMGAEGIAVEPAGEQKAASGHHHILIDTGPLASGTVVPKDETHLHFGKGQTEAQVALSPGKHELTLQFADGLHLSYGPELSASLELEVVAAGS